MLKTKKKTTTKVISDKNVKTTSTEIKVNDREQEKRQRKKKRNYILHP